MRVAVDAMGGDHAPDEIVKGSLTALARDPDLSILMVGQEALVRPVLEAAEGYSDVSDRITLRHSEGFIRMGDSPVETLRQNEDTSIRRCIDALRLDEVDAVVSAGDTGGVVAASTLFAKRLKGVKRQGIAIPMPTATGITLIIDVGANIHPKPIHLVHYAIMAAAYASEVLGIENPRVGLLSVGEEEAKGTDLVKKARTLLSKTDLDFVGNVEGQAVFSGEVDVIVCDGFVGNVILKVAEGIAGSFLQAILTMVDPSGQAGRQAAGDDTAAAGGDTSSGIGGGMDSSSGIGAKLLALRSRLDYSSKGGAPLLGVDGSVTICHGRSKAKAISNAIQVATEFTDSRVNDRIVEDVAKIKILHRMGDFFRREDQREEQ